MKYYQWLSGFIILCWIGLAISANWLPLTSDQVKLPKTLVFPNTQAWFGYDDLGRPVAHRLIKGAQISLIVVISVLCLSVFIGTFLGLLGGWLGGIWDKLLVFFIDVFMAFPGILLAIAVAGLLGPGINNTIFALSISGWVGFARLARIQTLSYRHRDHIVAAHGLGTSTANILRWHLLPLIIAPLIIEATFATAGIVIAEASLSFLGLGVQPPIASWGGMIRDGMRYLLIAPHILLPPAIAVFLVVMSINLLGDHLRDLLDVKYRPKTS